MMNPRTLVYSAWISIVRLGCFFGILFSDPRLTVRIALNGARQRCLSRTFLISFFVSITLLYQAFPAPDDPVTINDLALRRIIEEKLGKGDGETITEAEMAGLDQVSNLEMKESVSDLTGLEHAIDITSIFLVEGEIDDLSPLMGLTKLETLIFDHNRISNLGPLSALAALKTLQIQQSPVGVSESFRITDLRPLENLGDLERLDLSGQAIVNIPPLPNLQKLTNLDLGHNRLSDISGIGSLTSLTRLILTDNPGITDISALSSLTQLQELDIINAGIDASDLSGVLPHLLALKRLHMNRTAVFDLSVLESLPSGPSGVVLTQLYLSNLTDLYRPLVPTSSDPVDSETARRRIQTVRLKDLTPLVRLMRSGVIGLGTELIVWSNYNLDYDSFYTDIPALIAGVGTVKHSNIIPMLERESPENHVGAPGTMHTFVVRATATDDFPSPFFGADLPKNERFEGVPVQFTVTAPDGTMQTSAEMLTGPDGLARFTVTLGDTHGDTHTVEAFVPENRPAQGPMHDKLSLMFTATVDDTLPPIIRPTPRTPPPPPREPPLTVTFADYPEERPTDTFPLTIRFSEPVTDFRPDDITIETELKTGRGNPTVESLTPTGPARTYTVEIGLPRRATGTLKLIVRARAANSTIRPEVRGPATATASDPIDFGRRRVYIYPSHVPMDTIVFNEFRNAADDKNDWVELKNISDEPVALKEWEISLVLPHAVSSVASHVERAANDRDVVEFPDYTLPPGGILLLVNTDPSENDLIHGQNIGHPHYNPDLPPQYLIAPELRLPDTPYLLILRSARDKNGAWDGFEDLLGNYHRGDVSYRTQIWPLRDTWVYTGTGAELSDAEVYERVMIERVTSLSFRARRVPEKRGYLRGAWVPSEVHSGLGYRPGVSLDTALGTPGYPTPMASSETGTGDISISEVMFATNERGTPSQWIELYNASTTEIVNLEDYRLRIELRDHQPVHWHITFPLKSIEIMPRQTVLLVSRKDRNSENIPARQIYDAERHLRRSPLLRPEGFSVRLLSPNETLVDTVGNLDGSVGRDTPRWALLSGFTETGKRSSLIRRYEDGVPARGTAPQNWVRAAETSLLGPITYYGLPTDNSTPGYRQGSPLPVTLSSFRAERQEGGVVVNWTTASEMENAGFHVLRRGEKDTDFQQVTPELIPGAGTTSERQTYTYRDTTAQANVPYLYRLEEVSLSGERRAITTVRMRGHLSAVGKSIYKWADVKKSKD